MAINLGQAHNGGGVSGRGGPVKYQTFPSTLTVSIAAARYAELVISSTSFFVEVQAQRMSPSRSTRERSGHGRSIALAPRRDSGLQRRAAPAGGPKVIVRARAAAVRAEEQTKRLYEHGGALDSQTTESQWLPEHPRQIERPETSCDANPVTASLDDIVLEAETAVPSPPSINVQVELEELRDSIRSLQAALAREERLSAMYRLTIDAKDILISELQQHLDLYRLDPSQESQVLLDDDHALPSTQQLLELMTVTQPQARERASSEESSP